MEVWKFKMESRVIENVCGEYKLKWTYKTVVMAYCI